MFTFAVAILAASSGTSADLSIVYDGRGGGLDGFTCSVPEFDYLLDSTPPTGTTFTLRETGFGVLHDNGRFVLSPTRPGDSLIPADAIAATDRKLTLLDPAIPFLESVYGIFFQWPRGGRVRARS